MSVLRRVAAAARQLAERSAETRAAIRKVQRSREQELRQVIREEKARGGKDPRVIRP